MYNETGIVERFVKKYGRRPTKLEYSDEYRMIHESQIKERGKKYRETHREEINERSQRHQAKRKEEVRLLRERLIAEEKERIHHLSLDNVRTIPHPCAPHPKTTEIITLTGHQFPGH